MTEYRTALEERRLWKYILFGVLTLGIYDWVFMWKMLKDLNRVCGYTETDEGERSPNYLVVTLLSLVTLQIYGYIWYYKQGNRMRHAAGVYGFEIDEKGTTYLLWMIFGVFLFGLGPLIALYLFICNMNKLAKAYNYRVRRERENRRANIGNVEDVDYLPQKNGGDLPFSKPQMEVEGYGRNNSDRNREGIYVDDTIPTESILAGTIECIRGDYSGARITISPGEKLVIGRNSQVCQIVLPDKDISRTHCSIRFDQKDKRFYVTDLSTYQTTYLNDTIQLSKGVERICPLGSKLTLGNGKNQFILK